MKKRVLLAVLTLTVAGSIFAQAKTDTKNVNFVAADIEKARELLVREDDFTRALTEFDRSARLKTSAAVTNEQYLEFVGQQAMDWTEEEKARLDSAFAKIKELFAGYKIKLPKTVYLVKTTGLEEGGSAYCRGQDTVVFGQAMLACEDEQFLDILIHELFHIFSKNNLNVREKLYRQIGFYKTAELELPENIRKIKITNPDSVQNNYCFKFTYDDVEYSLVPVLLAVRPYDEEKGGEFFEYMGLVFFIVDAGKKSCTLKEIDGSYHFYEYDEIPNYLETVGMNTEYIIHAEEILADNFVFMIRGTQNLPSPFVVDGMRKILKK